MISAMPAVAVRREREKNRQGKLIGDPFGRVNYIPGHHMHHLPTSYYHPVHHHHHNSSKQHASKSTDHRCNNSSTDDNCVNTSTVDKGGLKFLIYSGFGCLAIGLICLFVGIVTIKNSTTIIGLVFIGLGGLFCIIKFILSRKSSSSSPQRVTTTRVETNGGGEGGGGTNDNNSINLNLIRSSINQSTVVDPTQTVKLPNPPTSMNNLKPTGGSFDCLNQTSSSKSIDHQYLEAS